MRRDDLLALLFVCLVVWCGFTYYIFSHKPLQRAHQEEFDQYNRSVWQRHLTTLPSNPLLGRLLEKKYELADKKIKDQMKTNSLLLDKLKVIRRKFDDSRDTRIDIESFIKLIENPEGDVDTVVRLVDKLKPGEKKADYESEEYDEKDDSYNNEKHDDNDEDGDIDMVNKDVDRLPSKPVIPVLLFSCNRVTVSKALDLLITYRPSKEQFPIVVSQDCDHQETRSVSHGESRLTNSNLVLCIICKDERHLCSSTNYQGCDRGLR